MSMTTHQIEELRNLADAMKYVKANRISKILREAAETISELSAKVAAQNMEKSIAYYNGGWIPVSERLPEMDVEVLATTEWGEVTMSEMYSANDWFIHEGATNAKTDDVLAWMPLPEPMKVGEENC